MQPGAQIASPADSKAVPSKATLWIGYVISALVVLFLLMDAVMKVMKAAPAMQGTVQLGFPASLVPRIGIVLLICAILYAIPRTSVLGAILLTGYLGGAVAIQLRIENPLFRETLFPLYLGVLMWGALFLRDARLRALIPLRTRPTQRLTSQPERQPTRSSA